MRFLSLAIVLCLSGQVLWATDPQVDLRGVEDSLKRIIMQLEENLTELGGDISLWSSHDIADADLPHIEGHTERSFDRGDIEWIVVDSKFLDVKVTGHEKEKIDVEADIEVWTFEKRDLTNVVNGKFIEFAEKGKELRITCPTLGNGSFAELARMEGEIRLLIPKDLALGFVTRFSKLTVEDHEGPLRIDTQFGDLHVRSHKGDMEVNSSYSNVNIERQTGDTNAQLQFCEAIIDGIEGDLNAESRYGYLSIDKIEGDVDLKTQGTLELGDISGDLQLDSQFGDADIGVVEGNLKLNNKMGNVHIERVNGQKQIQSQYGKVRILEVEVDSKK
jgi:hypothetical protein